MSHCQVDLCGKESGTIWTRKLTPNVKDGLMCEVSNTKTGLTSQGKHLQFTKVAFGCHGNWMVAGDQHGNIYKFDLQRNRFKLVFRGGHSCTALACCIGRPSEVLVALADYLMKCIDVETSEIVATLRGHEASVKSISLHSSGRHALAVSSRDAVLWDLDTFARCRTLSGGQEVGVQDVFFQPMTNTIITCFKDNSIHAWEAGSLDYKYQIPPPYGPTPYYRAFAVPQDGRLLVGGGRSHFLHVWAMENRQLLRIVQLPTKIRVVKQLIFLPDNFDGGSSETLGFLAQDGIMRFINVHSCKHLFQVGSHEQPLNIIQVSPDGKLIAGVTERGNIVLHDVNTLTQDLHRPPAPLVRMMDDESETSQSQTTSKVSSMMPSSSRSQSRASHRGAKKVTPLIPRDAGGKKDEGSKKEDVNGASKTAGLDMEKLHSILRGYGSYPAKYRTFIWRCLLQLPENHASYSSLLDKGTHSSYLNLHQDYPIKSRKLLRVLQRALSALAHWSPIFGETHYLPELVFPFVKLFQNNQLITFEMLATILLNWCSQWFEYFPNPPLNILAMVENCLAHHDSHLLEHFIKNNITSHQYAWPLLMTLFSEVLSRDEWLRLWDNILSNHPGFLLLCVVAYLTTARHTLLKCTQQEDFEYFFHHPSSVDIGSVIQEAYHIQQTTPSDLHPESMLEPFVPLTKGTYPVFNKYPKFIVNYQVQERERIRKEELQYLRERQSALELERLTEQRKQEEEAWYRQQHLLMEAEEQRRKMLETEEQKLTDQRARLQALKREVKVKEIHVLDVAKRRFMQHQQAVREAELKRMDDDIKRKVLQRDAETRTVLDDIETRALELERQKALLEQELARCQEEMLYRIRADGAAQQHKDDLEQSMLERAVEEEAEREREKLNHAHMKLAKAQTARANMQALHEAQARRTLHDIHREVKLQEASEKLQLNRLQEKQIKRLVHGLEGQQHSHIKMDAKDSIRLADTSAEGRVPGLNHSTDTSTTHRDTGLTVTTLTTTTTTDDSVSAPPPQHESPGVSALQWSRRRDLLDQQEADLLSRVRELRQKVVGQMNTSSHSGSISTSGLQQTPR